MRNLIIVFSLLSGNVFFAQNFITDYFQKSEASKLDTIISIQSNDKNVVEMPITLIKGAGSGPTFTIMAGIHGMEYPTIMSLVDFSREINPKLLNGNIIILPVVNQPSFFGRVPFKNPMDGLNLNRVFPGTKNGSITEVMADFMTSQIFPVTDILLDMHGGDVSEDLIPFICYYDNKEFKEKTALVAQLSKISGFEKIVIYPYHLKKEQPAEYAFKQAVRQGIASFSIEIGRLGQLEETEVKFTRDAIYRIFSELKMYPETVKNKDSKIHYYTKQSYISVPVQGLFYSTVKAGDLVKKGENLGVIQNVFGKTLKEITSETAGIVLYKVGTPPVNVGETLFCIAQE